MWIAVGIGVVMSLVAIVFIVKYSLLKSCVEQAGQDMAEILKNPEENRILLAASPRGRRSSSCARSTAI